MTTSRRPRHPFPTPTLSDPSTIRGLLQQHPSTWKGFDLPDAEAWMATYQRLFAGAGEATYPQRARRLHDYGFTPHVLTWACTTPYVMSSLADPTGLPEDRVEALTALTREVTLFHTNNRDAVRAAEVRYTDRLLELGWRQPEVAALLGVTKQRVSQWVSASRKQPRHHTSRPEPMTSDSAIDVRAGLAHAASLGYAGTIAQLIIESALADAARGNLAEARMTWEANYPLDEWNEILAHAKGAANAEGPTNTTKEN